MARDSGPLPEELATGLPPASRGSAKPSVEQALLTGYASCATIGNMDETELGPSPTGCGTFVLAIVATVVLLFVGIAVLLRACRAAG